MFARVVIEWILVLMAFIIGAMDIALMIYIVDEEKKRKEQRKKDKIFFKMILKEMENLRDKK